MVALTINNFLIFLYKDIEKCIEEFTNNSWFYKGNIGLDYA